MQIRSTLLAVTLSSLISACASFDDISKFDPSMSFDSQVKLLSEKLERNDTDANQMVVMGSEDVKALFSHDAVVFDARPTFTGPCQVNIDFTVAASPEYFFNLGEYSINKDNEFGVVMVAWLSSQLATINEMIKSAEKQCGAKFFIAAQYQGSADGVPVHPGHVKYDGDFGEIIIPAESATLNGEQMAFHIWPGKNLLNQELATVRAAGLAAMVADLANPTKIETSYKIETSLKVGSEYRFARVYLQIGENDTAVIAQLGE